MKSQRLFGVLGLAFGLSLAPAFAANWAKARVWNDKRAEVAVYDAERVVNGKTRAFKEYLITSKETVDGSVMFKFNQASTVDTGNYPEHELISVVTKDDNVLVPVKVSRTVMDWTGSTVKSMPSLELEKDEYFDEQLALSLRAFAFADGIEKKIKLRSLSSEGAVDAVIKVELPKDPIRGRAGSIPCWVVSVKKPAGTDIYWFEKADPNLLIKMETADGKKRLLYGRARWSYWDKRIPRPNILN